MRISNCSPLQMQTKSRRHSRNSVRYGTGQRKHAADLSSCIALKYHPDRNPGHEVEFNAKFQAIQSANEVLTDPQQRAKYDAQRIRAGYLHTYSNTSQSPSRPPASTRTPTTNFPPPPRPPPPPTPRSKPPQSSGAHKYSNVRFSRPEANSGWGNLNADDVKAKTNDFKAWEQMRTRHGQGPIPTSRPVPPKPPRASTFQPGREPPTAKPTGTTPRRSGWERWQESQADIPGLSRSNTTRPSPKKNGFAPSTPGGDEPQASGSAYFKVSRSNDPTVSRPQNNMPPPPPRAPTARKPDPLQSFKDQIGLNEPFGKKQSPVGSQYYRDEGTNLRSPPNNLHRAATSAVPRESHSRTGVYDGNAKSPSASQARATSTHSNHHSTSPPAQRDSRLPGVYSSSSSSESSSDEEGTAPSPRKPSMPNVKTTQSRAPSAQRRPGFNLYAKVEDAGDEKMAPRASPGEGIRRHSAIDLSTENPLQGFQEHRKRHEAAREKLQSSGRTAAFGTYGDTGTQPSLIRSRSWQEKYRHENRSKRDSLRRGADAHPKAGSEAAENTMYGTPEYIPFSCPRSSGPPLPGVPLSDKWSDQWPFKSPRKPRSATAESIPPWAIPSSLPPPKRTDQQGGVAYDVSQSNISKASIANYTVSNSFTIPKYPPRAPNGAPPLRSHSSEKIDTNFSPEGYHPRFFEPSSSSRTSTPLRTVSPTTDNVFQASQNATHPTAQSAPASAQGEFTANSASADVSPPPPPPAAHEKYYPERWVPHLNNINFDMPNSPQARSPSRTTMRKRTWARGPTYATVQPQVKNLEDEPTAQDTAGEDLSSSKMNIDGDAMDIDEPTPPSKSGPSHHMNGTNDTSETQTPGLSNNTHRAPTQPPRIDGQGRYPAETSDFNLGNLKTVFPLAPSNEGLGNMNDLVGDLPFESRPSPTKPNHDINVQRFDFPQPPKCPINPSSLTASSCQRHGQNMRGYMNEWNNFNSKMTNILNAKKVGLHTSSDHDLFDINDTGFDEYMKALSELRRARVHYDAACDRHEQSMQDLGLLRQEMKRGRGRVPF